MIIDPTFIKQKALINREPIDNLWFVHNDPLELTSDMLSDCMDLEYIQIRGMGAFWKQKEDRAFNSYFADLLNGLNGERGDFVYSIFCVKNEIKIFMGCERKNLEFLISSLRGLSPYIQIYNEPGIAAVYKNLWKKNLTFGGILAGHPTDKIGRNTDAEQLERLLSGNIYANWGYTVVARSVGREKVVEYLNSSIRELSQISKYEYNDERQGIESYSVKDYSTTELMGCLGTLNEKLKMEIQRGAWIACAYFGSEEEEIASSIGKNLKSIFNGKDSVPESMRITNISNLCIMQEPRLCIRQILRSLLEQIPHPCIKNIPKKDKPVFLDQEICFNYATLMSSDDLAILAQLIKKEFPGYYINQCVEFDSDNKDKQIRQGISLSNIFYGKELLVSEYKLELNELNRHGLIVGITGSGKTNTSKYLLHKIYQEYKLPFLVIESAKREYWELCNLDNGRFKEEMNLFTVGEESYIPLRLNPFEKPAHIALATHVDSMLSAFKAAFDNLWEPLPFLLENAIYACYEDKNFDLLNDKHNASLTDFPTVDDLYYKIEIVLDAFKYGKESYQNLKSALEVRINSLRTGSKGLIFNTKHSTPISELLKKPTVLELDAIGDDEIKSFIMGVLLTAIYEERKKQETTNDLKHIILIEEAHRLLKNTQGENSITKRAVSFFCDMLAEVRSYGQGFLIADQIPTKLALDVIQNTNLKIVHRTVFKEDRELVGESMNMTSAQINYLNTLEKGCAAVYSEGDVFPKLVKFPNVSNQSIKSFNRDNFINGWKTRNQEPVACINYSSYCAICRCCQRIIDIDENQKKMKGIDAKKIRWLFLKLFFNFSKEQIIGEKLFEIDDMKKNPHYLENTDYKTAWKRFLSFHEFAGKNEKCILARALMMLPYSLSWKHEWFIRITKKE